VEFAVTWLCERMGALLHQNTMLPLKSWVKLHGTTTLEARQVTPSQNFLRIFTPLAATVVVLAYPVRLAWEILQKRKARAKAPAKRRALPPPPPPKATAAKSKAKGKPKAIAQTGGKATSRWTELAQMQAVSPFGRRVHWVSPVYQDNDAIGSTVFGTLASGDSDPAFDRNLLTAMFKEDKPAEMTRRRRSSTPGLKGKAVLDTSRAQILGIAFSKIRMPIVDLCRRVTSLDTSVPSSGAQALLDDVELLAAAMPTQDEKIKLQRHEHEIGTLRKEEQWMMSLCNLSPGRLRLMKVALTHKDVYDGIARRCEALGQAAEEVRMSVPFKRFLGMALQVGNFINTGEAASHKGSVRGFAVESLSVLAACKKGPVSALHFLCLTIRSTDMEFLDKLLESLQHVHMASTERAHALKGAVVDFGKEVDFVIQQFGACGEDDEARNALLKLRDTIQSERRRADHLLANALHRVTEAQAYFNVLGTASIQPPAEEFFQHIASFLQQFKSAWIEVARHGDRWQKLYAQGPSNQELVKQVERARREPRHVAQATKDAAVDAHSDQTESTDCSMQVRVQRQVTEDAHPTHPTAVRRGSWRRELHKANTRSGSTPRLLAGKMRKIRRVTPHNAEQPSKQGLCSWYALHTDDTDSEEETGMPVSTMVRAVTAFANIIPGQAQTWLGDEHDRLKKIKGFSNDTRPTPVTCRYDSTPTPVTCRLLRSWIEWLPQEDDMPRFTTL